VIGLYEGGRWDYPDTGRKDGFSVVLFLPHGPRYRHPPVDVVEAVRTMDGVSSVQITFYEDKDPSHHAMPPGGFRVAIVNATTLAAGREGREVLRRAILEASGSPV
jgi:hypothetical protein